MANYESTGNDSGPADAGELWMRALSEEAPDTPTIEDETRQSSVTPEPESYSSDATEALRELQDDDAVNYSDAVDALRKAHDDNNESEVGGFMRKKNSLELLQEADEEYDPSTMDSLEAAEKDVKETFWKKAGKSITKVYRKLIGFATGKKIETSAESAEATREVAGKIGKKLWELGTKLAMEKMGFA